MLSEVAHQKSIKSAICLALTLLLAGAGCSRTPAPQQADVGQTDSAVIEQRHREQQKAAEIEPNPVTATVTEAIVRETKRINSLPGRTGILAERWQYSVFAEEIIIRDFFQDRRGGFFVDVGAAWPVYGSNTYYLEKHLGWTGIGIDALSDFAPAWAEKRPDSKFLVYLVTDKAGGEGRFFKSAGLGISSTDRKHASGGMFGVEVEPEEISVPKATLNDILDSQGITKVDLVSMDIEGHELPALRGFDIDRFQPELLVIEGGRPAVRKYFERHGYEQIDRYLELDSGNRYFQRKPKTETPVDD